MGRSSATLQAAPRGSQGRDSPQAREGHRDTVEAIVVAFILALVVRGFEAQAFVIPTGSMAPTLMGRHKEIACPQCGFVYAVNASEEAELQSAAGRTLDLYSGLCVNCRYQALHLDAVPSFKGDRILVMMFPYDLPFLPGSGPPERWDVVVFRYPEEPEVSYIKRLVGLPGETIRIYHGDVFVKSAGRRRRLRRPASRCDIRSATQITVYDDRYRPRALARQDRMAALAQRDGRLEDRRSRESVAISRKEVRRTNGSSCAIGISCPIPSSGTRSRNDRTLPREPRATLITDFYSYNTNMTADYSQSCSTKSSGDQEGAWMQPHWVGDLTLAGESRVVKTIGPTASVRLELVKGGLPHRCTIDLGTGTAVVTRGDDELAQVGDADQGPGALPASSSPTSTNG